MKAVITILFSLLIYVNSMAKERSQISIDLFNEPNEQVDYIAITLKNGPMWSIYWDNPGDSGKEFSVEFSNHLKKFNIKKLPSNVPQRHISAYDFWTNNLDGTTVFFYKLTGDLLNSLENGNLKLSLKWLSCNKMCVQESRDYSISKSGGKLKTSPPKEFKVTQDELAQYFQNLAKEIPTIPSFINFTFAEKDDVLYIYYSTEIMKTAEYKYNNLAFFFKHPQLSFNHEELFYDNNGKLFGRIQADLTDDTFDKSLKVLLNLTGGLIFDQPITLQEEKYIEERKTFYNTLNQITPKHGKKVTKTYKAAKPVPAQSNSLFYYMVMAFLGGLILNIMPCVLPVITLKLFGLVKVKNATKKEILSHNLSYTFGVLISFLALAAAVILLKSAGKSIGWGFQMQSPLFIFFLIILVFAFSLNLFGLFEIKTPFADKIGNIRSNNQGLESLINGIFATILATPCSAPFLGTAMAVAFTSEPYIIVLLFMMIGLGLSFPILLTGIFPALIKFLPKPGGWMLMFKKFLGLTLLLTTIWLLYILSTLNSEPTLLLKVITILFLIFMYFYVRFKFKKYHISTMALILMAVVLGVHLVSDPKFRMVKTAGHIKENWEVWSPKKMRDLVGKQDAFIEFTAEWCITCKTNDKLIISTDEFKNMAKKHNLKLLIGDYTASNPVIDKFLRDNGKSGVPAYFIQKKDGTLISIDFLPSVKAIEKNLK